MPLPHPRGKEKKNNFISRCISSVKDEYRKNKQRVAICFDQWRSAKDK